MGMLAPHNRTFSNFDFRMTLAQDGRDKGLERITGNCETYRAGLFLFWRFVGLRWFLWRVCVGHQQKLQQMRD